MLKQIFSNKLILALGLACCFILPAQAEHRLLVKHDSLGKAYEVYPGLKVKVRYAGYLDQEYFTEGVITAIDSQQITLNTGTFRKSFIHIRVKDITGMRFFGIGWQLAKVGLDLSFLAGNVLLYTAVLTPSNLSPFGRIAISTLAGGTSLLLSKVIFHKRLRYKQEEGWRFLII